jgi:sugar O-acyltransferase (sialic acid O-acetyltransferase NeuD family)
LKKLILFGLTGLSKGLIEQMQKDNYINLHIDYIYIDKEYKKDDEYEGIKIISDTSLLNNNYCIIPTFNREVKSKWMILAESCNMEYFNIIHKDSYISKNVKLGKGNFIGQQNIIERDVTIGDFFICGYQNRIGHDSIIGNNCHVYVQSNIGGFNTIGNNIDICSSSATREKITIGDNSIIGLGAIVFRDVKQNTVMIGNPAKGIKNAN